MNHDNPLTIVLPRQSPATLVGPASSLLLAMLLVACTTPSGGTGTSAGIDAVESTDGTNTSASTGGTRSGKENIRAIPIRPGATAVTAMRWTTNGDLCIGYADGTMACLRIDERQSDYVVLKKGSAVRAIDPTGSNAIVIASAPEYVNRDGRILVRFTQLPDIEAVAFSPSGQSLVIAETSGKIHVWRTKIVEDETPEEKLSSFLKRQQPSFTGHFPDVSGPIAIMDDNTVVFGKEDGRVVRWLTDQGESVVLFKMEHPMTSVAAAGTLVAATSSGRQFAVGGTEDLGLLKWARGLSADAVTQAPSDGNLVLVDGGKVVVRTAANGDDVWSADVPDGELCGLDASPTSGLVALCIGNTVLLLESATGTIHSWSTVDGQSVSWNDPDGKPVK